MKKIAVLLVIAAVLIGLCAFQVYRWEAATHQQLEILQKQQDLRNGFMNSPSELWINQAAEEALSAQSDTSEQEAFHEFVSPEGIRFVSDSEQWDETKLKQLYEELLLNRHGDEFLSLDQVYVHGKSDAYSAATHADMIAEIPFSLHFPLFSEQPICTFVQNSGNINLYGGDRKTSIRSMASDLSHEYGHHFVASYILKGDGSEQDINSEYAKLRDLDFDQVQLHASSPDFYYKNHKWMLMEIAAEDYVVLMGSPNAMKRVGEYADIRDQLEGEKGTGAIRRNAAPQENMFLPFAAQVPGLADYYYSFIGESAPEYPDASDLKLHFERHTGGFRQLKGYPYFLSYEVTWDKVLGEDATYTLVCLDPETEEIVPLATVQSGEKASAEIGAVPFIQRTLVTWRSDGLTQGTKQFLIVVTLPDGRVAVSEPVDQSF